MSFGGGYFDAGDDEEVIDRHPVFAHQTLLEKVGDRITGVVIGDRQRP